MPRFAGVTAARRVPDRPEVCRQAIGLLAGAGQKEKGEDAMDHGFDVWCGVGER